PGPPVSTLFPYTTLFRSYLWSHSESCPSWSKEHDWKSCRPLTRSQGFKSLALRQNKYWPVGQVVKTPPFHGGNTGSNPVRVTIRSEEHTSELQSRENLVC